MIAKNKSNTTIGEIGSRIPISIYFVSDIMGMSRDRPVDTFSAFIGKMLFLLQKSTQVNGERPSL